MKDAFFFMQIKIHHILLGCVLLDDEANSWKTTPQLREQLQSVKKYNIKHIYFNTISLYSIRF